MRALSNRLVRVATLSAIVALPLRAQSSRDSAGVLVVENARPTWTDGERLRLAAHPRLLIGNRTDSSYRFRQVRGVMLLADGRIAVADGGSLQLRMFSPQGRFLSASAGKDNGAGQGRNMYWARRLRGDTIAIGSSLSAVALHSPTGEYLRTVELPPRAGVRSPSPFLLVALLNGGLGVAAPLPIPAPHPIGARWIDSLALTLVTDTSRNPRAFGTFPSFVLEQVENRPTPVWLSATAVVAADDDHFYVGFGDRYAIHVYSASGTLQSIIRRSWTPVPVTDADWEQWVVEWSKLWVTTTGAERDRDVQKVRESPWAEELPAFTQLIVDRGGRLWVRGAHWQDAIGAGSLSDIPAVPSTWSVFDVRGRWLGDVTMPADFQPFEIGADYVAGVMRTDGVSQIAIYDMGVRK